MLRQPPEIRRHGKSASATTVIGHPDDHARGERKRCSIRSSRPRPAGEGTRARSLDEPEIHSETTPVAGATVETEPASFHRVRIVLRDEPNFRQGVEVRRASVLGSGVDDEPDVEAPGSASNYEGLRAQLLIDGFRDFGGGPRWRGSPNTSSKSLILIPVDIKHARHDRARKMIPKVRRSGPDVPVIMIGKYGRSG